MSAVGAHVVDVMPFAVVYQVQLGALRTNILEVGNGRTFVKQIFDVTDDFSVRCSDHDGILFRQGKNAVRIDIAFVDFVPCFVVV